MAKWGEGDPRWIVEERPDATNVNNWHWTEKNASDWSTAKINLLFKNLNFDCPGLGKVTITELSKCEGESTANNRKGKLILFYEWNVEMEWSAKPETQSETEEVKGKIEITNFSEENEPHEIDITVTLLKGGSVGEKFKEFIRLKGIEHIREKVALYIQALKDEYATDLILPTKNQPQAQTKNNKTIVSQDLIANVKNIQVSAPQDSKTTSGVKFSTTTITMSQDFKCTADEIYKVFTVPEMVSAFTRGEVKLTAEKGGKFNLFGGNICGEFVELLPHERIVQKWRFKTWPDNHFSQVTLIFTQGDDSTKVDLRQSGVPVSDAERTRLGWQNYYWDSIKRTFGFGATLI